VDGVIFVYDVQEASSLSQILKWLARLKEHRDVNSTGLCIMGNKTDVEGKSVSFEEA
jgi:GTPase SAR1 family protein